MELMFQFVDNPSPHVSEDMIEKEGDYFYATFCDGDDEFEWCVMNCLAHYDMDPEVDS